MGRTSGSQTAGLDLIDKLFFNQVLVYRFFTEELDWLFDLSVDLKHELEQRGISGLEQQIVSHGVLCVMEVELSDSILLLNGVYPDQLPPLPEDLPLEQFEAIQAYHKRFFQGMILAALSAAHQTNTELILDITMALLPKYKEAPSMVRYRLVERMFSFEFLLAPLDCFVWLSMMGVLKSEKHAGQTLTAKYDERFLPRLALLCEYDMLRDFSLRNRRMPMFPDIEAIKKLRKLPPKTIDLLLEDVKKMMDVYHKQNLRNSYPIAPLEKLQEPVSVQNFFKSLNTYSLRIRVFQGSLASWVGMLGGGGVELLSHYSEEKTPIFVTDFNDNTLTERVRKGWSARGIEITSRAIYDRYRDFKETTLRIVDCYYHMQLNANVAIPAEMRDHIYDSMAPHFDLRTVSPRRKISP